jgi:hypothetical protein
MRCISIPLLLVAACAACGSCLAQDAQAQAQPESQALQSPQQAQPRSAFGKVMAVMISSLQRQARERGRPRAAVRTSDAGTPLGIEVGDAFRMGMDDATSAQATSAQATGTGGAAADDVPRAAPPEPSSLPPASDYAVRQPALAGPG